MKDTEITEETRGAVLRAVSAFEEDDGTLDEIIRAAREDQSQEVWHAFVASECEKVKRTGILPDYVKAVDVVPPDDRSALSELILAAEQSRTISALFRLADRWPDGLSLFVSNGLHVIRDEKPVAKIDIPASAGFLNHPVDEEASA